MERNNQKLLFPVIILLLIVLGLFLVFENLGGPLVFSGVAATEMFNNDRVLTPTSKVFSSDERRLISLSQQLQKQISAVETAADNLSRVKSEKLIAVLKQERGQLLNGSVELSPEAMFLSVVEEGGDEKEEVSGRLTTAVTENFTDEVQYSYKLKGAGKEPLELATVLPLNAESGSEVKLRGYNFGNQFLVDPRVEVEIITPADGLEATGVQKTLAILVNFQNTTTLPFSTEEAQEIIFGGQFVEFFREQSYGRIDFDGDVIGWFTLPRDGNCQWPTFGDGGELDSFVLATVPDLSIYDRVIIASYDGCTNAGFSTIGKDFINLGGQNYYFSVAQVGRLGSYDQPSVWGVQPFPWTNLDYLLSHEMGHSLGLYHANGLDCQDTVIYGSGCANVEYGNPYDVMGIQNHSLHFNGFYKERLGWIKPNEVLTIDRSGIYKLPNLESVASKKIAKIKVQGYDRFPFYLESRRPVGFNSGLSNASFAKNLNGLFVHKIVNGLNLYVNFPNAIISHLLDLSPTSQDWVNDILETVLSSSNGFVDRGEGLKVGPVRSVTGNLTAFSVAVGQPLCVYRQPSLQDIVSVNNFSAGSDGPIRFSIRNRNSFLCEGGNFELSASLPSGWILNGLEPVVSLGTDQISFQEPNLFIPVDTSSGNYQITISVKNLANDLISELIIPISVYQAPIIIAIVPDHGKAGESIVLEGLGIPEHATFVVLESDQAVAHSMAQPLGSGSLSLQIPTNANGLACQCEIPLPSGEYMMKFSASGVWSNEMPFLVEEPE